MWCRVLISLLFLSTCVSSVSEPCVGLCKNKSSSREIHQQPLLSALSTEHNNGNPGVRLNTATHTNNFATHTRGCCPCEKSVYTMHFQGLWSKETHPRDFPSPEHLNHFSDILVVSHSDSVSLWTPGFVASAPLKRIAEFGDVSHLKRYLIQKGASVLSVSRASGLWHPHVTGNTSTQFSTDARRPLLSIVTMIGPSPDWILAVSSLNLCSPNCQWYEHRPVEMKLYDAGTDSGRSYMSFNTPTIPAQPVREITNKWPPNSPFFEPTSGGIKPLARVTLTRERSTAVPCSSAVSGGEGTETPIGEILRSPELPPECGTTPWSPWTQCSGVCGAGIRMRSREYIMPVKAAMMECHERLVEKVFCDGDCPVSKAALPSTTPPRSNRCAVTEWTEWSACSTHCGIGIRSRKRKYISRFDRKVCKRDNYEKETCLGHLVVCPITESMAKPSDECRLGSWSEWSPCSRRCGRIGRQTRRRVNLIPATDRFRVAHNSSCANASMSEQRTCVTAASECSHNRHRSNVTALQRTAVSTQPIVNCSLSNWTTWSVCSATCPYGRQSRFRHYLINTASARETCSEQLVEFRKCSSLDC